jgi:hypothetical protein
MGAAKPDIGPADKRRGPVAVPRDHVIVVGPGAVAVRLGERRRAHQPPAHRGHQRAAGVVIGIEDCDVLPVLVGDEVALQPHVFVPAELIEVVGGDVRHRGDRRGTVGVLQLGMAYLKDDAG